jgi:hypothetical protein
MAAITGAITYEAFISQEFGGHFSPAVQLA